MAAALCACGSGASGEDGGAAASGAAGEEADELAAEATAVELDIERVDSVRYLIDREAVLAAIVESVAAGVTATEVDGGFRLGGIGVSGALVRLGLLDGDVVVGVGGIALDGRLSLRRAFAVIADMPYLRLTLQRAGRHIERRYHFRDRLGDVAPPELVEVVFAQQPDPLPSYTALLDGLRGGVRIVAPDRVEVDRAVLDLLGESPDVLDVARKVPVGHWRAPRRGPGRRTHVTLYVGAEPSVFTVLGLTPWDEISAVDGETLLGTYDLPFKVVDGAAAGGFTISVSRLGEPMDLRYEAVTGRADEDELRRLLQAWRLELAQNAPDFVDPFAQGGLAPLRGAAVDYATGVEKLSDTNYRIDPDTWDAMSDDPGSVLMSGALLVPEKDGAKMVGLRVVQVQPGSLHEAMGLVEDDVVTAIAGVSLVDFDKGDSLFDLVNALTGAAEFTVVLKRGGDMRTHEYTIQ